MVIESLCGSRIGLMVELPVEVGDVAPACLFLFEVGLDPNDVCHLVNLGSYE